MKDIAFRMEDKGGRMVMEMMMGLMKGIRSRMKNKGFHGDNDEVWRMKDDDDDNDYYDDYERWWLQDGVNNDNEGWRVSNVRWRIK